MVIVDKNVTLFLKESQKVFDVSLETKPHELTIFLPKSDEVISVDFNKKREWTRALETETGDARDVAAEDPSMESLDELMWKEQKIDIKQLPQLYLRLSKIRLTGKLTDCDL